MKTALKIGKKGEAHSKDYFIKKGYQILEQNWRFYKSEIDLIVQKENTICFVEIKTRSRNYLVDPILSVSASQQKRILKAAHHYIELNSLEQNIRFDVVGIVHSDNTFIVKHIKEAFYPTID